MEVDDRRKQLRAALIDLFVDAAKPGQFADRAAVIAAGVPRAHAEGVVRNSLAIESEVEGIEAADEWSAYIAEQAIDSTDPRQLAAHVPR